jgi:hypothetical protein
MSLRTMPLFWKPYKSDFSTFLEDLKTKNPQMEANQRAGRALLWDKKIDRDNQTEFQQAKLPRPAYAYHNKS